ALRGRGEGDAGAGTVRSDGPATSGGGPEAGRLIAGIADPAGEADGRHRGGEPGPHARPAVDADGDPHLGKIGDGDGNGAADKDGKGELGSGPQRRGSRGAGAGRESAPVVAARLP